jgi:hypothetical protein
VTRHATTLHVVTASVDEKPEPFSPLLTYQFESLIAGAKEFAPLFAACIKEVGPRNKRCPPAFNMREAVHGEVNGALHLMSARVERTDELVGFILNIVGYPTKYSRTKHGQMDLVWLHPKWRHGWNAINMCKDNLEYLKRIGVQRVLAASPVRFKNKTGLRTEKLYRFLGFKPLEVVYETYLVE